LKITSLLIAKFDCLYRFFVFIYCFCSATLDCTLQNTTKKTFHRQSPKANSSTLYKPFNEYLHSNKSAKVGLSEPVRPKKKKLNIDFESNRTKNAARTANAEKRGNFSEASGDNKRSIASKTVKSLNAPHAKKSIKAITSSQKTVIEQELENASALKELSENFSSEEDIPLSKIYTLKNRYLLTEIDEFDLPLKKVAKPDTSMDKSTNQGVSFRIDSVGKKTSQREEDKEKSASDQRFSLIYSSKPPSSFIEKMHQSQKTNVNTHNKINRINTVVIKGGSNLRLSQTDADSAVNNPVSFITPSNTIVTLESSQLTTQNTLSVQDQIPSIFMDKNLERAHEIFQQTMKVHSSSNALTTKSSKLPTPTTEKPLVNVRSDNLHESSIPQFQLQDTGKESFHDSISISAKVNLTETVTPITALDDTDELLEQLERGEPEVPTISSSPLTSCNSLHQNPVKTVETVESLKKQMKTVSIKMKRIPRKKNNKQSKKVRFGLIQIMESRLERVLSKKC